MSKSYDDEINFIKSLQEREHNIIERLFLVGLLDYKEYEMYKEELNEANTEEAINKVMEKYQYLLNTGGKRKVRKSKKSRKSRKMKKSRKVRKNKTLRKSRKLKKSRK